MFASKDVFLKSSGGGYTIARSVRLRSSASAYLNRTSGTPTSGSIFTHSFWVKRGTLGAGTTLISGARPTNFDRIYIQSNDTLLYQWNDGTSNLANVETTQVFRDSSAWYHIVVATDTTQATASNRVKIYVNGVQVTALTSTTYPSQNSTSYFNTNAVTLNIGRSTNGTFYLDGYMTEINFVDGQALTPSSFGATDAITGVWQPTKYSGTYGTNGFYLNFSSNSTAAALGTDSSGNSNTWTVNNISVTAGVTYDSMTDVPTLTSATVANYAVLNPLAMYGTGAVISNANLTSSATGGPSNRGWPSTIAAPGSGKWYAEFTFTATDSGNNGGCGIMLENGTGSPGESATTVVWLDAATIRQNASGTSYGTALSVNDILIVAYDAALGRVWFGKNGTWFASGDPATNANPSATGITTSGRFATYHFSTAAVIAANFGQRPFSYTAPSGFVALNTYNLSTPTIPNGATQMNATIYTGTGSNPRTFTGLGFQPDWIWNKSRSNAGFGALWDSVRGGTKAFQTYSTSDETTIGTAGGSITSFNSDGATFANGSVNDSWFNSSSVTYVSWQWKANGTGVTNTSGSITSTVSANTTAGFAVVTYTGTGANATVGHGLGVAPSMIIVKSRSQTSNWLVWHTSLPTPSTAFIALNLTDASANSSTLWNSTVPTSSVFSLGTNTSVNNSASTYVAYAFAAVAGYSAFGSYTGNGSADGPFVYTAMRPRFIMLKRTDSTSDWRIYDSARTPSNADDNVLEANTSDAEDTASGVIDVLSNGFKLRDSGANNISAGTYIYMAFAENPFKYSLAR